MRHMVHAVATVLMMALFIGHSYIGTIGMEGACEGMKTGYVDETWAREHHELWYDDIKCNKRKRPVWLENRVSFRWRAAMAHCQPQQALTAHPLPFLR